MFALKKVINVLLIGIKLMKNAFSTDITLEKKAKYNPMAMNKNARLRKEMVAKYDENIDLKFDGFSAIFLVTWDCIPKSLKTFKTKKLLKIVENSV